MFRTRSGMLAAVVALTAASASFAQTGGETAGGQAPASGQGSEMGSMASGSTNSSSMGCRQIVDEVSAKMNVITNERKKALAMRDVEMAKAAMAQKQEAACEMHAHRAMELMK